MTQAKERSAESIVLECELPEAPEKVWRALTERELLAAWLMPNDFRPELGAEFRFEPPPELGDDAPIACKVLALEPPRLLRFSWQEATGSEPGSLSFVLTPTPAGGTHLVLIHRACEQRRAARAPELAAGTRAAADTPLGQLLFLPAGPRRAGRTPPECLRCAA